MCSNSAKTKLNLIFQYWCEATLSPGICGKRVSRLSGVSSDQAAAGGWCMNENAILSDSEDARTGSRGSHSYAVPSDECNIYLHSKRWSIREMTSSASTRPPPASRRSLKMIKRLNKSWQRSHTKSSLWIKTLLLSCFSSILRFLSVNWQNIAPSVIMEMDKKY